MDSDMIWICIRYGFGHDMDFYKIWICIRYGFGHDMDLDMI